METYIGSELLVAMGISGFHAQAEILLPDTGVSILAEQVGPANPRQAVLKFAAPLAIFNEVGSQRVLKIDDIYATALTTPRGSGINPPQHQVTRVTAASGGYAATVVKNDSNNADLPSQVLVAFGGGSVTRSGAPLRKSISHPGYTTPIFFTRATPSLAGRFAGGSLLATRETQAQAITLREGEGLAFDWDLGSATNGYPVGGVNIALDFAIGSECYTAAGTFVPATEGTLCYIFNGSGSGVVIKVGNLSIQSTVVARAKAVATIVTISDLEGGQDFNMTPLDSANTLLPSSRVKIKKRAKVSMDINQDSVRPDALFRRGNTVDGIMLTNTEQRALARDFAGFGGFSAYSRNTGLAPGAVQPLVLREGEGVALYFGLPTGTNVGNQEDELDIGFVLTAEYAKTSAYPELRRNPTYVLGA